LDEFWRIGNFELLFFARGECAGFQFVNVVGFVD